MTITPVEQITLNNPEHARGPFEPKYDHGSAFVIDSYCSVDEASVPITDTGFIHADAAYDVVSASKGVIFRFDDHLDRFESACEKFRLKNPYNREQTKEILTNLVKMSGTRESYIFWCVTRGAMPEDRGNNDAYENLFYAFVIPYLTLSNDEQRSRGIDINISKYIRIPPESIDPTAKNFHWMDMKLAMFDAKDQGKEWCVMTDAQGNLAEAPGSNVFFIKDGELYTPDKGCLEGITRKTVLELAEMNGIKANVTQVHKDQLLEADEAFLCTTAGGILPINSVDDVVLGGVAGPGEITTKLHNQYWEKRWEGWLGTPVNYDEPPTI
jgi:branched-chain amino acid aminotransferase